MSPAPFIVETVGLFLIVLYLLNKYSSWREQNKIVLIATFIAWYFSFMIIFLLPLDISLTTYQQCLKERPIPVNQSNSTIDDPCHEPWSLVPPEVFAVMWRIIYWTSQALTWLILPFMQAFSQSGEFTLKGKMRYALIANAIYYGSYLAVFGVLLIYVAIKVNIDGQKLKVIGITAANTWGLFLLVLLLGYGLVAVPRSIWFRSTTALHLKRIYFKVAKLHAEKCEAEETLEDVLVEIKTVAEKIRYNHGLRECIEIIVKKCPDAFRNNLRRNIEDYVDYDENSRASEDLPSEKQLVGLHYRLIKALQVNNRTLNQWTAVIEEAFEMEDVLLNETNTNRSFVTTQPTLNNKGWLYKYTLSSRPRLEWLYQCWIKKYALKLFALLLCWLTLCLIWSESTFFNKRPVLSLFALFLGLSRETYNFFIIELICCLTIAYLAFCAYYTIFKMRVFNFYYLTPNHQTNEYSLIFSGTLVCRLTSPLCYNFLGLLHLDSHITKDERIVETQFTQIMGHMDVVSFISDGFNIYFPMCIILLCLATLFNLGGRFLHFFGFEHFFGDAEVTLDLIEDGKNLVKREKRRIQRNDPEVQIRHRDLAERLRNNFSSNSNSNSNTNTRPPKTARNGLDSSPLESASASSSSFTNNSNQFSNLTNSAATTLAKGFQSVKSTLTSKMPAFLYKPKADITSSFLIRPKVREYRDIPPYKDDDNNDEEYLSVNSNESRLVEHDDYNFDYASTNQTRQSNNGGKSYSNNNKNIRSIFDDV